MEQKFSHWLAGFIAAEGHFDIDKTNTTYQCGFNLSLRDDDYKIIHQIKDILHIGNIFYHPKPRRGNPKISWAIQSKGDCHVLRELLAKIPLRAKKQRDFDLWSKALDDWSTVNRYPGKRGNAHDWTYMSQLMQELRSTRSYQANLVLPRSPDEGFIDWFQGFIEGEGTFYIPRYGRKKDDVVWYACTFALGVRDDDASIIYEIKDRLGFGGILYIPTPQNRPNQKPAIRFYTKNKGEANLLRDLLVANGGLKTKKNVDFEIWSQALDLWNTCKGTYPGPGREFNWSSMEELRLELITRRAYKDDPISPRYLEYLRRD